MANNEEWKDKAERLKFDEGKSWTQVYSELTPYFDGLSAKQIEEKVRGYLRRCSRYTEQEYPRWCSLTLTPVRYAELSVLSKDTATSTA